jgi:hypothetical protein
VFGIRFNEASAQFALSPAWVSSDSDVTELSFIANSPIEAIGRMMLKPICSTSTTASKGAKPQLTKHQRINVMKTLPKEPGKATKWMTAIAITLFGLFLGTAREARAAEPTCSQNGPMIKNLMALTYRAPCAQTGVPEGLTRNEVKRLTATAESREDHLKLARYYEAQADSLDSRAAGYEKAAASYRRGPIVKNLMAPSTAGRYAFLAKGFRDEARSDRVLAASQETAGAGVAAL